MRSSGEDDAYVTISSLSKIAPQDWTMYTHPRGSMYFRHKRLGVVVDEDIRIPANLDKVAVFCAQHRQLGLPDHMEAHTAYGVDASVCLYVNHRQCVAGYIPNKLHGSAVKDFSVDGLLRARRLYWSFVMQHPSHRPCHPQGFVEAIDALRYYHHDHLIDGSRSIAPFSRAECEQLLDIMQREKGTDPTTLPSVTSLVAWVLKDVYSFRTGQRYGQVTWTELRSYRKSLYNPPEFSPKESLATRLFLSILINGPFFGIPQTYLAHIKKASEFRGHLAGLRQNWESISKPGALHYSDFILIATVLLSATIGILTINDVEDIARTAAMLAAFASLGSITVGVFFVWRHQRNTHMPSSFSYLHNARNNPFGLSGHAILLSLPPVLLVWSIIAFTTSVLAYALQDVARSPAAGSQWVVLGIFVVILMGVMIGVYTFSTIWSWQSRQPRWRGLLCWPTDAAAA
ncbi:hypothetical protein L226DRAFT_452746 [Lentinus tigrinus ALCF2SS1-7]|uniref:Uncharacterized protein n=1 Tax=Lentinus tigrinus ALCF2SS1-6 TaxID=1328759 RepID=A0A5C2SVA3_9APHY|nr:hypothetical protein L227DRAFT_491862 [Lentinus tigrinus ALCF2SS1-6]RPD80969.1 hypothetical protein L226DRAFT_452746 [Lentinus tigrinus ALCF2SS1-7]